MEKEAIWEKEDSGIPACPWPFCLPMTSGLSTLSAGLPGLQLRHGPELTGRMLFSDPKGVNQTGALACPTTLSHRPRCTAEQALSLGQLFLVSTHTQVVLLLKSFPTPVLWVASSLFLSTSSSEVSSYSFLPRSAPDTTCSTSHHLLLLLFVSLRDHPSCIFLPQLWP